MPRGHCPCVFASTCSLCCYCYFAKERFPAAVGRTHWYVRRSSIVTESRTTASLRPRRSYYIYDRQCISVVRLVVHLSVLSMPRASRSSLSGRPPPTLRILLPRGSKTYPIWTTLQIMLNEVVHLWCPFWLSTPRSSNVEPEAGYPRKSNSTTSVTHCHFASSITCNRPHIMRHEASAPLRDSRCSSSAIRRLAHS